VKEVMIFIGFIPNAVSLSRENNSQVESIAKILLSFRQNERDELRYLLAESKNFKKEDVKHSAVHLNI
jgi:hypothetical protein